MTVGRAEVQTHGNSGEQEITRLLQEARAKLLNTKVNYLAGLQNFEETLEGRSAEAVPAGASAVLKSLGASAVDMVIEAVAGSAAPVVTAIRDAVVAYVDEQNRAADAGAQLQVGRFIRGFRNRATAAFDRLLRSLETAERNICNEFRTRSRAADTPGHGSVSESDPQDRQFVHGAPAQYLEVARRLAQRCSTNERRLTAQYCQREITRAFISTPGLTHDEHPTRGARPAGTLYLNLGLTLSIGRDGQQHFTVRSADSAWTLVTLQGRSESAVNAAVSLRESLEGKGVWEFAFPHQVRITVDADDRAQSGLGVVMFNGGSDFASPRFNPHDLLPTVLQAAWAQQAIRRRVMAVRNIEGSNE